MLALRFAPKFYRYIFFATHKAHKMSEPHSPELGPQPTTQLRTRKKKKVAIQQDDEITIHLRNDSLSNMNSHEVTLTLCEKIAHQNLLLEQLLAKLK